MCMVYAFLKGLFKRLHGNIIKNQFAKKWSSGFVEVGNISRTVFCQDCTIMV